MKDEDREFFENVVLGCMIFLIAVLTYLLLTK